MRVHIVLNNLNLPIGEKDAVIGVDYGSLVCAQQGISMLYACGDFDSISESELLMVEGYSQSLIRLPVEKDMTDFTFALSLCDEYEEIIVHGALGGRKDHEYIHIKAVENDSRIHLYDRIQHIYKLDAGQHQVDKGSYHYFSIFPLQSQSISLMGFKYELDQVLVSEATLYLTSNEIIDTNATIISNGGLLIVQSNDQ